MITQTLTTIAQTQAIILTAIIILTLIKTNKQRRKHTMEELQKSVNNEVSKLVTALMEIIKKSKSTNEDMNLTDFISLQAQCNNNINTAIIEAKMRGTSKKKSIFG